MLNITRSLNVSIVTSGRTYSFDSISELKNNVITNIEITVTEFSIRCLKQQLFANWLMNTVHSLIQ